MARLPIRIFGDPVLRSRAAEVTDFDAALARLAEDMLETMRAAEGAGLAANQVGVLKRLFTWEESDEHGALVNPEVVETSEETQDGDEGCLSFPGLFYPTERPFRARVRGRDVHGDEMEYTVEELRARIFLHELDHLNGILFIDHLARHDRKEAMRRIREGELEQPRRPAADDEPPAA
ncbi:peptide deformylase [Egibacter rhizosphaerae]|uniref:Peptide deformylase n=1 Tax=Egibacter rhizosphaerae TaxID=1670831 RepID=A0A411YK23_9ACTN|nr:peptide deformylase [Egibacter rhizosphaerae]QBI21546.1 peptide deformylase [Egibacter rhizosphaerae]